LISRFWSDHLNHFTYIVCFHGCRYSLGMMAQCNHFSDKRSNRLSARWLNASANATAARSASLRDSLAFSAATWKRCCSS